MDETPLTESEQEELVRLRAWLETRHRDRTLRCSMALAGFIWGSQLTGTFKRSEEALWAALPDETKQQLFDFVQAPKKGPVL